MKTIKATLAKASMAAVLASILVGCQTADSNTTASKGTHRMGTPKDNYQMSNEQMPGHGKSTRTTASSQTDTSGTHRMGTPKENYQMSNEQMRR